MQSSETIPQEVKLAVVIPEPYRRHLKAEAARRGVDMGVVVMQALDALIGPPADNPNPEPTETQES